MPRITRFVPAFIAGMAMVTWAAAGVLQSTVTEWFERDVNARAQLVMVGARQSVASAWFDDENLKKQLMELARDERVIGVALCNGDSSLRVATPGFPEEFACGAVGARIRSVGSGRGALNEWTTIGVLPAGRVHLLAMPLAFQGQSLGFAMLLHDLSFVDGRVSKARAFVLFAVFMLGVAAAVSFVYYARRARSGWSAELRRMLRSGVAGKREFQPILRDVREMMRHMASEREEGQGQWTARRLKQTLNHYLRGERVVIVSNREPYIHERQDDGSIRVKHPASGLVTALEPVMLACSGVWVAHGAGSADRQTVDRSDHVRVPPGTEAYHIRRVWLNEEQEQGYYYGFSNEGLWPLCHIAHTRPIFRAEDWRQYRSVNQRFADAVCEEVDSDDPIILVQDYHFALAPAMIRERLPAATVITFWHIPWPNAERMGICPWRHELLDGLLGSSIVGFHTPLHCNNFLDSADRYLETRIDRENNAVVMRGQRTLIRPYPIAIEWPVRWAEDSPSPEECRAQIWKEFDLKPNTLLGIGVDRLDYTKGVEERLLAVELLLERFPEFRGRFSFVQLAAPSRTKIERYQQLNDVVTSLAGRINERFGAPGYRPVILLQSHFEPADVYRFYRAADVCYVSSLHDGMNLVAKEFVASRTDLRGVLVLSEFTGAARELTEALIVNPYDLEASSDALAHALTMPSEEQRDRMRSMRTLLSQFNVYRWAGKMLIDAARLRDQERLSARLTTRAPAGASV